MFDDGFSTATVRQPSIFDDSFNLHDDTIKLTCRRCAFSTSSCVCGVLSTYISTQSFGAISV